MKLFAMIGVALMVGMGLGAAMDRNFGRSKAFDEMGWTEIAPDSPVQVAVLWGDPAKGEHGRLIKLPAGFAAPVHAHTGDYHGINLTGTWRHAFDGGSERELPAGSYVFQPGEAMHGDSCVGPEDCVLFLHQHTKADFIPKE